MGPIINWEELRKLAMPPRPADREEESPGDRWGKSADMYNRVAKMEKSYTLNQINAFDTSKEDTVLDVGCGPGRISVPMAQRAGSVTSVDASEDMLAYCRQNAEEAGVTNLKTVLMDWDDAVPEQNIDKHDIVIASRSPGMGDIEKTCSFARKYVVMIAWANAPNIPTIVGDLFKGVDGVRQFPPMRIDRSLGYNVTWNMIYDMGYDPCVKIVTDGFTKDFSSREAAYEDLWKLLDTDGYIQPVFKRNVDTWLTENNSGGVTFRRETRSFVMWWNPNKRET